MSTVLEAIAARHVGIDVLGISLATNLAAGISPVPLDAADVIAAGDAAAGRLGALLRGDPRTAVDAADRVDLAVVDATVVTMDADGTVHHRRQRRRRRRADHRPWSPGAGRPAPGA